MVQALMRVESFKILPHYLNLRTSLSLIISKILRGKSPLFSPSPLRYGKTVALLHKKLDIGSRLSFSLKSIDSIKNLTYVFNDISRPLTF